jgi:hypothetical protein
MVKHVLQHAGQQLIQMQAAGLAINHYRESHLTVFVDPAEAIDSQCELI